MVEASGVLSRLHTCLDAYDEAGADVLVSDAIEQLGLADAIASVLMPFMREVGARWQAGRLSVTQEHLASHIVRSRLAALTGPAALATGDVGPVVVVACPPGERHDIAPLAFSVLLRHQGWSVRYLGADTPMADLAFACGRIQPDLVVVAASRTTALLSQSGSLRRLATRHPLAVAGAGASPRVAHDVGASYLAGDVAAGAAAAAEALRAVPAG